VSQLPGYLKERAEGAGPTTKELVKESVDRSVNLARLLIASPEFRKLINDIHSVVQDALTTVAPIDETQQRDIDEGERSPEKSPRQALQETKDTARSAILPTVRSAAEAGETYVESYSKGESTLQEAAKAGTRALTSGIRQRVSNISLPKERRDVMVDHFKNLMFEAQTKKDYQDALENLIGVISSLSEQTQQAVKDFTDNAPELRAGVSDRPALKIAEQNAKQLVENFASHKSLDPLINALSVLPKKVQKDQELREYLKDLRTFVLRSLREAEFVRQTDYVAVGSDKIEQGRSILLGKYKEDINRITHEAELFNNALQEDKTTRELVHDFETLTQDLFFDEAGKPTIKLELVRDFAKILPRIGESLQYIALPRIENSDDEYDYIFDNIVLHLSEIVPKHVHMNLSADIDLDRPEQDHVLNTMTIDISKLHADARNIAFYYKKKKGLVNMMDVGRVDFSIPEEKGLRIHAKVLLRLPTENSRLTFEVLESSARMHELKIRLHDTKHDFLYKLVAPLVQMRIRTQVEHLLSARITDAIKYLEQQITRVQASVSDMQRQRRKATEKTERQRQQGSAGQSEDKRKQRNAWESESFGEKRQQQQQRQAVH
jgi:hypothetical protein